MIYRILADLILLTHVMFVLFVILGQLLIIIGLIAKWRWVRGFWFRLTHLVAIGIVVAQALAGVICPLTIWENQLRLKAGEAEYPGSFTAYWVSELLFYTAEPWIFTVCYCVFGATVLAAFILGPPRRPRLIRRAAAA